MAHFLKHLTEDTITLKKLLVPAEFVTKCGRANLTNPVVLEPTVGDPLEVELYEDGSGFWLRNGWPELADQYSLRRGHYLLFEYRSYSRFKLVMLGANGLELVSPTPKLAYFLKHVTEDTIRLKKLLIPSKFVMKCGRGNLTNPVVLEPTVGDPQEVELYEDSSGFWLRNGWPEFVDGDKTSRGYYLLFEYKSYSRFKLLMLGANGLDLEFQEPEEEGKTVSTDSVEYLGTSLVKDMNNNGGGGRQQAQLQSGEDAKLNEFTSASKRRATDGEDKRKANWEASQRNNRSSFVRDEAENYHIPSMEGKLKQVEKKKGGREEKRKRRLASPRVTPNHPLQTKMRGVPEQRRDNASTSSENPNFSITISQYHLNVRFMNLPATFVYRHMMSEDGTIPERHAVMVSGEEGIGPWALSFVLFQCEGGRTDRRGSFCGGWPSFRKDNSLKPGDVCRFELISDGQMKVTIRRC